MRTQGKWTVCRLSETTVEHKPNDVALMGRSVAACGGYSDNTSEGAFHDENIANAKTVAIAGTAANQIDAMGYDGDKAIEMLPKLVEALSLSKSNAVIQLKTEQFIAAISEKPHDPT